MNPGRQRGRAVTNIDWDKFLAFVMQNHKPKVARDLFSYGQQFSDCLITKDFTRLQELRDSMRPNALRGLSALSKFLGCHTEFMEIIRDYGLKWTGKSADDLVIERLTSVEEPDEIWTWIKEAKKARPDLTDFLDLMAYTGVRLVEAVDSYNLIIKLNAEKKLGTYYMQSNNTLEHFRFKEKFIRRSKKVFVSFVPAELIETIVQRESLTSSDAVQKLLQKKGMRLRFGDIREAHATFMTKFLKKEEIDFLHGRVTSGVFMQHYFNPALISDLKTRAFQGIAEIQEKVKI